MVLFGKQWFDSLGYYSPEFGSFSLTTLELAWYIDFPIRAVLVTLALYVSYQHLTRATLSLLIVTSLIVSPYSGATTIVIVLAIGVVNLFKDGKWWWGFLLLILYQELYVFIGGDLISNHVYIISLLLLTYTIFLWELLRENRLDLAQKLTDTTVNAV